ncbi:MAG: diacylglycerol kinase family lipid kinase [Bacteroidales bacterium]|nr:diacylglycerol kinase family lipid kinase [Bacteroidales bacterium]
MESLIKDKWVFIVNPIAGNGFGKTMIPIISEKIKKYGIDGEIVQTERSGHAVKLSGEYYEKGCRNIIGVGGDGTANEVARPLINRQDVVFGVIPAGTGNDFIQITGFHDRMSEDDWDVFFKKHIIPMDAGSVNGMVFLNGMGLGFDAQVAAENYTEPGVVKKGGKHKYLWHIIKTILFFREKRMAVTYGSGRIETDCFINTVSVGRRFAGGFLLTPRALANDGLLDVCSIKRLNLIQRLKLFMKVPKGNHIKDKKVFYYQTDSLKIEFPGKVPFHVDGELNFSDRFDVRIIPEALNIIYNPDGNHFFRKKES